MFSKRNFSGIVNGYIVPFGAFIGATPVVPAIFWDVYDAEQRWKWVCCNLSALIDYSNEQTKQINELSAELETLKEKYDSEVNTLTSRVEALEKALETITTSMLVYDPTKGVYTTSIDQSRRMLQMLGQPSDKNLTVSTVANNETVESWATNNICAQIVNESMKRFLNVEIPTQDVGGVTHE